MVAFEKVVVSWLADGCSHSGEGEGVPTAQVKSGASSKTFIRMKGAPAFPSNNDEGLEIHLQVGTSHGGGPAGLALCHLPLALLDNGDHGTE